jgi:hypothetical protein
MECPNIQEIAFSQTSIDTIKRIRSVKKNSLLLNNTIPIGHVMNIFFGNGVLKSSYNFYSTNFKAMGDAMSGLSDIAKRQIYNAAGMASLSVNDPKERQFWIAIANGCKID